MRILETGTEVPIRTQDGAAQRRAGADLRPTARARRGRRAAWSPPPSLPPDAASPPPCTNGPAIASLPGQLTETSCDRHHRAPPSSHPKDRFGHVSASASPAEHRRPHWDHPDEGSETSAGRTTTLLHGHHRRPTFDHHRSPLTRAIANTDGDGSRGLYASTCAGRTGRRRPTRDCHGGSLRRSASDPWCGAAPPAPAISIWRPPDGDLSLELPDAARLAQASARIRSIDLR
jgi:hypothetical protein